MSKGEGKQPVEIRGYLLNNREDCERLLRETGKDLRLDEIEGLIQSINNSKESMYERRKRIDGLKIIYGEGKVVELLNEVFNNYILGNYYSAIATCSMAAERFCYDYIDSLEIKFGNKVLTETDKEELTHIPFNRLLSFLLKLNILDDESHKMLFQMNGIRNRHIHPKMRDTEKDALEIVNLLCHVLESRLSMFRFYDLVDGKFVRKYLPSSNDKS